MTDEEKMLEGRRAYKRDYMREWRKKNQDKVREINARFYLNHYKKMKEKEGE